MSRQTFAAVVRRRLASERGRIDKQAPFTVALGVPSTYRVGMSSLGALALRRRIQQEPGMACERFFLPDDAGRGRLDEPVLTYESLRTPSSFPVIALSVAYELELGGVVQLLQAGGVPARRTERSAHHPFVLAGGSLTWSNPLPLAPFADAIVMGEADELLIPVLRLLREASSRAAAYDQLASLPSVLVPGRGGESLPPLARAPLTSLPARSELRSPEAELSNMVLVEAARGCPRTCRYCVMRRAEGGGMRIVPADRVLQAIPEDAERVGLVGAAVSDHPQIAAILRQLVDRGCEVGLSSLRPERLDEELVAALAAAGYRTLTTAMDGSSQRLRDGLDRRITADHLRKAARLARAHGMARLKLYLMVGVPGETEEDLDEAALLIRELTAMVPISLALSPFCAKPNTPLGGEPFAGVAVIDRRLRRFRRALRGRAEVRATSVRWAYLEHLLAQGDERHGEAVERAVGAGGSFRSYLAELEPLGTGRRATGRGASRVV
ncbi:MAG: radical SAM protein [Deltaproteobacteria bacterium]|jgi:radical SAM superfamily enzyme YgiQ (UPF0313 family)|nr:radical SAM protein [Deltaproteobacteria bacterium]MBW2530919.1 radical SAM protein [Deltaproteobacteria bacterium]